MNSIRVPTNLDPDQAQHSVNLVWLQTVNIDQQQMTKFAAGRQRVIFLNI